MNFRSWLSFCTCVVSSDDRRPHHQTSTQPFGIGATHLHVGRIGVSGNWTSLPVSYLFRKWWNKHIGTLPWCGKYTSRKIHPSARVDRNTVVFLRFVADGYPFLHQVDASIVDWFFPSVFPPVLPVTIATNKTWNIARREICSRCSVLSRNGSFNVLMSVVTNPKNTNRMAHNWTVENWNAPLVRSGWVFAMVIWNGEVISSLLSSPLF